MWCNCRSPSFSMKRRQIRQAGRPEVMHIASEHHQLGCFHDPPLVDHSAASVQIGQLVAIGIDSEVIRIALRDHFFFRSFDADPGSQLWEANRMQAILAPAGHIFRVEEFSPAFQALRLDRGRDLISIAIIAVVLDQVVFWLDDVEVTGAQSDQTGGEPGIRSVKCELERGVVDDLERRRGAAWHVARPQVGWHGGAQLRIADHVFIGESAHPQLSAARRRTTCAPRAA